MSEISHSDELVTKQDLSNFYQGILPYLGGMPDVVGGGFAPVGTIIAFMGTTAPQDYLACDGATYNIADYPQLTAFFAAQFGSVNKFGGDGVTTFKVPDLRGEFLRGTGTNGHSGQGSGSNVGTHQNATNHNMVLGSYQGKWIGTGNTNATSDTLPNNFDSKVNNAAMYFSGMGNIETSSWVQGSQYAAKYTSRPTNTSVLYCIKAIESGQVYSTEERIIGTWIDGKPLYQKTISQNLIIPATSGAVSETQINLTALNIDTIISREGFIVMDNDYVKDLPYLTLTHIDSINKGTVIQYQKSTKILSIFLSEKPLTSAAITITIQYTKS